MSYEENREQISTLVKNSVVIPELDHETLIDNLMARFATVFHEGRVAENDAFKKDPRGLWYSPENHYLRPIPTPTNKGEIDEA